MALSRTDIANRALDAIGYDNIGSINDTSKSARLCNRLFVPLRDDLLRRHPWNFAMKRTVLPAMATAPVWQWSYAYQLPTDCIRVTRLNVSDPTTRYAVEGGVLVTDIGPPLGVLYISRVEDEGHFDALFATCLVTAMARDLAWPLGNNAKRRTELASDFTALLRDARSADAAEGTPDQLWADTLIDARLI